MNKCISTQSLLSKLVYLRVYLKMSEDAALVLHPCRKNYCLAGLCSRGEADVIHTMKKKKKATFYLTVQKTYSPCPDRKYLLPELSEKT